MKVNATFQAAADDLFDLLTNEKKIPMWTRAPAQVRARILFVTVMVIHFLSQSSGEVGSEYSLFGGGVKGKFISLDRPTKIVQTWALQSPTWPAGKAQLQILFEYAVRFNAAFLLGHVGTLTTSLDQSTDSTKVTFSLAGVPLGTEDEIKRNIEGY